MLPQKISNIIKLSSNQILRTSTIRLLSTSLIPSNPNDKNSEQNNRKLKKWRLSLNEELKPLFPIDTEPKIFKIFHKDIKFDAESIQRFISRKTVHLAKDLQKFSEERYNILGPDINAAQFVLIQGGKVKFLRHNEWVQVKDEKSKIDFPSTFTSDFILTGIDVSDLKLYYEALENFKNAIKVKEVICARSPLVDDWFVDKLSSLFPNLEYLDISDCPKVSERALEALYRTYNLKTLIVTNHYKSVAFELTVMMLEDCLPNLKVEILDPKEIPKPLIND